MPLVATPSRRGRCLLLGAERSNRRERAGSPRSRSWDSHHSSWDYSSVSRRGWSCASGRSRRGCGAATLRMTSGGSSEWTDATHTRPRFAAEPHALWDLEHHVRAAPRCSREKDWTCLQTLKKKKAAEGMILCRCDSQWRNQCRKRRTIACDNTSSQILAHQN